MSAADPITRASPTYIAAHDRYCGNSGDAFTVYRRETGVWRHLIALVCFGIVMTAVIGWAL